MASKPVFGYWDIRGLGHPIRYLLAYLEVDYEEKLYRIETERAAWAADKESLGMNFPNLPYLLDGDNKITESRAIMKYLCRTHKPELLGKTAKEQTEIDEVENFMYDIYYSGLVSVCYRFTDELHKEFKEMEAQKLGYLENFLKDRQWVAGDNISYVDFFVYEVVRDLRVYDSNCLDKFPILHEYLNRVETLPAIKKYIESPQFIKAPIFSSKAIIKI